ncbi:MAG: class I SAM-dependent methyltransferase [Acidobacteria bacterium]|nr:class I SAM-dependent methyltransferase [Acidobacteriota bacterium]
MRQVDLALLAEAYDFRPMGDAARRRAREAMSTGPRPVHIALDIGGGRGEHASVWAAAGVHAVLIDPSSAMLAKASPDLHTILAIAQSLPIVDHAVDMVYFHLSIHYGDWKAALAEACRVLRSGGVGHVYTLGNRHHKQSFLNRWFPSVGEIDEQRFPDPADIAAFLATSDAGEARRQPRRGCRRTRALASHSDTRPVRPLGG